MAPSGFNAVNVMLTVSLDGPDALTVCDCGMMTGVTVIETVAGALVAVPSFTVNVKLSGPFRFAVGV